MAGLSRFLIVIEFWSSLNDLWTPIIRFMIFIIRIMMIHNSISVMELENSNY